MKRVKPQIVDLCRQCENWTPDPWAICEDCRKEGFVHIRETPKKGSK